MRTRDTDKMALVKEKAIDMIINEGFEGFSMNKLARACEISVATLYIYYKDRDDLIQRIALEESKRMVSGIMKNFDPSLPLAEGLRVQWKNRYKYMIQNPRAIVFMEQLRSSTYNEKMLQSFHDGFREKMEQFIKNAQDRGELQKMTGEVFWSVAFAPLYALMRFNSEGKSMGGKPFTLKEKNIWEAFELVVKAFKPANPHIKD